MATVSGPSSVSPSSLFAHPQKLTFSKAANGDGAGDKSFEWTVQTYESNITFSPIFFLWLNPNQKDGISSHYFNITQGVATSTTSTSNASTTTSSALMTTSSASETPSNSDVHSQTPTSSAGAIATDSHSDGTTFKVALGVGVGVGIPLVLIAGVWIGMKAIGQRRRSRQPDELLVPLGAMSKNSSYLRFSESCPDYPQPAYYPNDYKDRSRYRTPVEMGPKTPAELG